MTAGMILMGCWFVVFAAMGLKVIFTPADQTPKLPTSALPPQVVDRTPFRRPSTEQIKLRQIAVRDMDITVTNP